MGKLLSWVAIGFAIYVAYKVMLALQRKSALRDAARHARADSAGKPGASAATGRSAAAGSELVQLVSCAHCGLQLPRDEAVMREQVFYCGETHARLGAPPGDAH